MKKLIQILFLMLVTHSLTYAQYIEEKTTKYQGKPIVAMELNGKRIWVLLDTGSDINVLDSRTTRKYQFKAIKLYKKEVQVNGFGSISHTLMEAKNVNLYFEDVQMKARFHAYDLSSVVNSIRERTGKNISGIIGIDLMRSYGFVIDLGNKTVSMTYKVKKKDFKSPEYGSEFTIAKGN